MAKFTVVIDQNTYDSLREFSGGEIAATAAALIKAALEHTTRNLGLQVTSARLAKMEARIEHLEANLLEQVQVALSRIQEQLLRRTQEQILKTEYVLQKDGPPWRRTLTMKPKT